MDVIEKPKYPEDILLPLLTILGVDIRAVRSFGCSFNQRSFGLIRWPNL